MTFDLRIVPPAELRVTSVGDWVAEPGLLTVRVARSTDGRTDFLVGIHELIEAYLYTKRRIREGADEMIATREVDVFDEAWEELHALDEEYRYAEPGDEPDAPYHVEHVAATCIERLLCLWLNMTWEEHEANVEAAFDAVVKARKGRK